MNALDLVTKFVNGNDTVYHVFPTTMFVTKYPDNFDEEFEYIEKLQYRQEMSYNENCKSVDPYILKHKELSKLKDFFYESIKKYAKDVISAKHELIVTNSWINKNEPGTGHSTHLHPNSIVSGTFCLRQNSTMPPTQYYNRYIPLIKVQMESQNSMNAEHISVPMVPGDLILFPSDIMHSVNVNVSNETRYSLSFNTFSNELGSNEALSYASWQTNVND